MTTIILNGLPKNSLKTQVVYVQEELDPSKYALLWNKEDGRIKFYSLEKVVKTTEVPKEFVVLETEAGYELIPYNK